MLIGLNGYGRSGKDTVGKLLTQQYGFRSTAFADLMRACAQAIDPIIGWYHERPCEGYPMRYSQLLEQVGYERAKDNPEVRRFLQRVGTEMGRRVFAEDFWVDMTFTKLDLTQSWAFTDVRFPNEAKAITDHDGFVVRVNRPGFGPANDHVSEVALDDWDFDYVLNNDASLVELEQEVAHLIMLLVANAKAVG